MKRSIRLHVDYRASLSLVGTVLKYIAVSMVLPLTVALIYRESVLPFVVSIAATVLIGTALEHLDPEPDIGHREGFLIVALTWLIVPIVGTIPYLVAGQGTIAHPVDALFESMSGFTTTGSTVLGEISFERHSRSILLWRQLTQWLGGMGIIVLMVAILPELSVGGAQLMREEAPGPSVEKLTPRVRETAQALWKVYVGLTVAAIACYYGLHLLGFAENMDLYNAVAHALTTLPTGGFSPEARSIEAFSPSIQWMMIPFMIVAGTNFTLLWYVTKGRAEKLTGDGEFRSYVLALGVVTGVLAILLYLGSGLQSVPNVAPIPGDVEHSARQAAFQAAAIVTTTGYASMDFNTWSPTAKTILLLAMFLGGSAGSAAGSIKIVRWYAITKSAHRELFTTVHPEAVRPVRMSNEVIDEDTLRGVFVFTLTFVVIFALATALIFLDSLRIAGLDLTPLEAMSAAVATLGNIGPGFGVLGPMNNFQPFSNASKLFMVFLMWIGRLEILSVLVILTPSYWRS